MQSIKETRKEEINKIIDSKENTLYENTKLYKVILQILSGTKPCDDRQWTVLKDNLNQCIEILSSHDAEFHFNSDNVCNVINPKCLTSIMNENDRITTSSVASFHTKEESQGYTRGILFSGEKELNSAKDLLMQKIISKYKAVPIITQYPNIPNCDYVYILGHGALSDNGIPLKSGEDNSEAVIKLKQLTDALNEHFKVQKNHMRSIKFIMCNTGRSIQNIKNPETLRKLDLDSLAINSTPANKSFAWNLAEKLAPKHQIKIRAPKGIARLNTVNNEKKGNHIKKITTEVYNSVTTFDELELKGLKLDKDNKWQTINVKNNIGITGINL